MTRQKVLILVCAELLGLAWVEFIYQIGAMR